MSSEPSSRIQTISPAILQQASEKLESLQGEIEALRKFMDVRKLKAVDVDGGGKWRRASKIVKEFIDATEYAIKKAIREQ